MLRLFLPTSALTGHAFYDSAPARGWQNGWGVLVDHIYINNNDNKEIKNGMPPVPPAKSEYNKHTWPIAIANEHHLVKRCVPRQISTNFKVSKKDI